MLIGKINTLCMNKKKSLMEDKRHRGPSLAGTPTTSEFVVVA